MERYFIIVIDEITGISKLAKWQSDFKTVRDYQDLFLKSSREENASSLPQNNLSIEWSICVAKSKTIFKGVGADAFQELLSSNFFADIPSETWDMNAFKNLNNCAVDIIIEWEDCPEFWKSFNPSNNVKVFHQQETVGLNQQLFWRGSLKMRDPQNPSNFGQLENAELSYGFDQLDLLTSQIKGGNLPHIAAKRKTFCSFLELVSAFNAHAVPFIFYTSTTLVLSIQAADSFWKALNENVSFLFRLDYASEEVENRGKEMGAQSIYLLSHWTGGELKLFVLKEADQLQNLANVYVRLQARRPASPLSKTCQPEPIATMASEHLLVDRLEKEIRRIQLLALQTWIKENGSIDQCVMNELMNEVALAVAKDHHRFSVKALPQKLEWPGLGEAESLKWKLEKKTAPEIDRPVSMGNRLLQPNGRLISVDVPYLLRCLGKKQVSRSPKKLRPENVAASRLKPQCDLETARATEWPQSASLKYHGINYNLSVDDEKAEKQRTEYQDKWVPSDSASAAWCNPWSINSSTSYQLSIRSRQLATGAATVAAGSASIVTATRTPRTPKKNQEPTRDLAQLRKSPRLLAKTSGTTTRASKRTPSKKNNGAASAHPFPKDTFKQQLKAVIIKVLGDQQITTKDPLFRTCANKLSVICMALLNDSKSQVTPRQMYQVAKSQAKQVLQFVKP